MPLAFGQDSVLCHPFLPIVPLGGAQTRWLGSDFSRVGLLFESPIILDDEFVDSYGVQWLCDDGRPAPILHPLEFASLSQVAAHARPVWPSRVQVADAEDASTVVLDAPCPGLLETCFALRNGWQFMQDLTDHWRVANALLDWALETVVSAYEQLLAGLPHPPDLLIYGDDYGFTDGMFLSAIDFRQFLRPRLQTLLSRLRRICQAPILFHTCGAVRQIIPDLVALGIDALNLDPLARGMALPELRKELPSDTVLHGPIDFIGFGQALAANDMKFIAILATELARCAPAVAAPIDNLTDHRQAMACQRAAAFVHALDEDDWLRLRRFGAVKSILEHGLAASATLAPLPPLIPDPAYCEPSRISSRVVPTTVGTHCAGNFR